MRQADRKGLLRTNAKPPQSECATNTQVWQSHPQSNFPKEPARERERQREREREREIEIERERQERARSKQQSVAKVLS